MILSRSFLFALALVLAQDALCHKAFADAQPAEIEKLLTQTAVPAAKPLRSFYAPRAFHPLWTPQSISEVEATLKQTAQDHGLDPVSYSIASDSSDAGQEVGLTVSLTRLGRDLASGRIAPYRIVGGIGEGTRPRFDEIGLLKTIAQGTDPRDALLRLTPQGPDYQALVTGLKNYRALAAKGCWPRIPEGPNLKPGDSDERLPLLRKRLIVTGELDSEKTEGEQLDQDVSLALMQFQTRHGLESDGAMGKRTFAALNVPVEYRIRQIELALERLRQLPRQREANRIEVNIASQTLALFENKLQVLEMRVVTGDVKHQTPTMVTRMSALTLNPTWTVPASIARKEILPKLKRDPNYLAHNNIHILDAFPQDSPEAEGQGINWNAMGKSFPFVLRQVPGPDNALGQLKFNLQNQDAIYMHDTPQRKFFKRSYRLLSHGCIRLESPLDLADHVLGSDWHDKLPPMIAEGKTKTLIMKHSLPVYLMYQTAWADTFGTVFFRDDSYGNDQRLDQALGQIAQTPPKDGSAENL